MKRFSIPTVLGILVAFSAAQAQTTSFTYQGSLRLNNAPVTNPGQAITFQLFDTATGGAQVGPTLNQAVNVRNGLFTTTLDFGLSPFSDRRRWLQITVNGVPLTPRVEITPTPFALYSQSTRGITVDANSNLGIPGNRTLEFGAGLNKQTDAGKIGYIAFSNALDIVGAGSLAENRRITFWNEGGASFKGRVGIGLGSAFPVYPLSFGDQLGAKISLWGQGTNHFGIGIAPGTLQIYTETSNNDIVFGYGNSDALNETMRIKGAGNVGIGTSNPDTKLTVIGNDTNGIRVNINGLLEGIAVDSESSSLHGTGVRGVASNGNGAFGVWGLSNGVDGNGVVGWAQHGSSAFAVWGVSTDGFAGYFDGKVHVNGMLSKAGGTFKIDHPLDPANKYLVHSFVKSPEMMNVYNGNVTTDANGEAWVEMPSYFEALNRDFRYQLTVIGQFAQAIIGKKMEGNRFQILTNKPNVEVSWMVTGVRQDPWAEANRVEPELDKSEAEQGRYLHPELYGQPAELGINAHKRKSAN